MDHDATCTLLTLIQHLVLGFFAMCTSLGTAFLVHRRIRADRERWALKCGECQAIQNRVAARHKKARKSGEFKDA